MLQEKKQDAKSQLGQWSCSKPIRVQIRDLVDQRAVKRSTCDKLMFRKIFSRVSRLPTSRVSFYVYLLRQICKINFVDCPISSSAHSQTRRQARRWFVSITPTRKRLPMRFHWIRPRMLNRRSCLLNHWKSLMSVFHVQLSASVSAYNSWKKSSLSARQGLLKAYVSWNLWLHQGLNSSLLRFAEQMAKDEKRVAEEISNQMGKPLKQALVW